MRFPGAGWLVLGCRQDDIPLSVLYSFNQAYRVCETLGFRQNEVFRQLHPVGPNFPKARLFGHGQALVNTRAFIVSDPIADQRPKSMSALARGVVSREHSATLLVSGVNTIRIVAKFFGALSAK